MTRINVIPVEHLCDEHLVCELREILRIPHFLIEQAEKGKMLSDINLPEPDAKYTMGTGHVRFFYNKILFLFNRYNDLLEETLARGFHATNQWPVHISFPPELWNDYEPDLDAVMINHYRLVHKFVHKFRPTWSPHVL